MPLLRNHIYALMHEHTVRESGALITSQDLSQKSLLSAALGTLEAQGTLSFSVSQNRIKAGATQV